jgi:hypothetical protein
LLWRQAGRRHDQTPHRSWKKSVQLRDDRDWQPPSAGVKRVDYAERERVHRRFAEAFLDETVEPIGYRIDGSGRRA